MTREEIEQLNETEPYCFETDREEQCFNVGLKEGLRTADANPKSPWISVEDDLPYNHEELMENEHCTKYVLAVLAWDNDPSKRHIEVCRMYAIEGLHGSNWYWNESLSYKVTHWMPLPKIPD